MFDGLTARSPLGLSKTFGMHFKGRRGLLGHEVAEVIEGDLTRLGALVEPSRTQAPMDEFFCGPLIIQQCDDNARGRDKLTTMNLTTPTPDHSRPKAHAPVARHIYERIFQYTYAS